MGEELQGTLGIGIEELEGLLSGNEFGVSQCGGARRGITGDVGASGQENLGDYYEVLNLDYLCVVGMGCGGRTVRELIDSFI